MILFCFHDQPLGRRTRSLSLAIAKFAAVAQLICPESLRVDCPNPDPYARKSERMRPITKRELATLLNVPTRRLTMLAREFRRRWPITFHVKRINRAPRPA